MPDSTLLERAVELRLREMGLPYLPLTSEQLRDEFGRSSDVDQNLHLKIELRGHPCAFSPWQVDEQLAGEAFKTLRSETDQLASENALVVTQHSIVEMGKETYYLLPEVIAAPIGDDQPTVDENSLRQSIAQFLQQFFVTAFDRLLDAR